MGVDLTNLKQRIYCHRGYWTSIGKQNSLEAFILAATHGFGIETDIRDRLGTIAISHDPAIASGHEIEKLPRTGVPIALNIKSDGLLGIGSSRLQELLLTDGTFVFDGSIPEMLRYRNAGLSHALRLSEYERDLSWNSPFVWLDAFHSDWWIERDLLRKLSEEHFVVVVSPELHKREHRVAWEAVLKEMLNSNENIGICTDNPDEFLEFAK
jgi:glycerophosphoryl diester phosphodiesterase